MYSLLGIDLGTSSVRATVMDEKGCILGIAQKEYQYDIPEPGWAEQDPEVWWEATVSAIREVISTIDVSRLVGVGFSGQMHALLPLGKNGIPLRNSIIWCDKRSQKQVDEIYRNLGKNAIARICHSPVGTGFLLPSLLWMKEQEPQVFREVRCFVLPKDYIRFKLTGIAATDVSDAAGTLLFDVTKGVWSSEILEAFSISPSILPKVGIPQEKAGYVTKQASKETHLPAGIPCVYGGADQVMQAIGNGIVRPGEVSVTIGTGGQLLSILDAPLIDKTYSSHCFNFVGRDSWYFLGASLNGGYTLKWIRKILGDAESYPEIDRIAEKVPAGSGRLLFLPYLNGERTPYMDSNASGIFIGLQNYHTRAHIYRAVMEGITFAMKDCMHVLMDNLTTPVKYVVSSGGASTSQFWLQMEADVFGLPVYVSAMREQASVGAAITAGVGVGLFDSFQNACKEITHWKPEPIQPCADSVEKYKNFYALYRELYQKNKAIMHRLAEM